MKLLSTFAVLTTFVAISLGSQVSDINADLRSITTQTQALDTLVKAFPASGGTLNAAFGIHTAALDLVATIDLATDDVQGVSPKPFSEADGGEIIKHAGALQPVIKQTLNDVIAKKTVFASLPIGGIPQLVSGDLAKLSASTEKLEIQLLARTPFDLRGEAEAIVASIDASFAAALTAYT